MNLSLTQISCRRPLFYLIASLAFFGFSGLLQAQAQCSGISGTISVGPTGTYTTLTAAVAATATGTGGSIIFELQSTYTSTGETFPITFPSNSCVNATRTMTIRPEAGATGLSITSSNTTATIDLNGASYIIFDGRPGGTGSSSELTVSNTAVSGAAFRFRNDADTNTIRYCTVTGVNILTTSGVILFSTTTGTNGNDWNTIDNCDLRNGTTTPTNIIYSAGTTAAAAQNNSNNTISNNRIFNYFSASSASAGVKLEAGTTDWTISNNRFFQTSTITATAGSQHSAIWINNTSGNNFSLTGNTIGYASAAATGSYTFAGVSGSTLIPIFLNVGTTTASSVQGNTISAIAQSGSSDGTSGSAPFIGIYVSSGLANIGNVSGNTIGSASATGSITYTSSSTSASDVMGIFNFGSSAWTVSNNTIGGFTVANSSTGAASLYGINTNTSTSVTSTIQNNIIGGTVANSMQSTSTAAGTQVAGIYLANSIATVTGNTIRNLTAAGGTGTSTAASVVGIDFVSTLVNNTVSRNTIFNLSNTHATAATTVTGIQYTASTGTNVVDRNFIYGLTSASNNASAEINGIKIAGGTTTYRNNMIAIGAGTANAISINGINETSGTDNFWHNSIYVGGTATAGAVNSFAFNSTVTTNTRSYRNNIFVNARSNSGATGKNYAIQVGGTAANPAGLTINNNIYFVSGTGTVFGRFNSTDVASLAAWRTAVGQDALSAQGDPQFINPTGATPDLHIHATNPSLAESNGVSVGVTDDFDGQTRASLTPVDIGADAGNFVSVDILVPTISYTPLTNTACVTSTTRTLSSVVILDNVAINVTTGTRPRLYYKKSGDANTFAGNTSADNGWKFVEASNTTSPFTFNIDYSLLRSAITGGDVIQYFVIAQDQAAIPNVTVNSGTFTTAPSSVALTAANFPVTGTINSFNILTPPFVSGAVTIGASGTYTSLTGTSGLFNAINVGGLGGNVTASIIDASVTETGAVSLSSMTTTGCASGTFSLLIRPAASTNATLTGSVASGALITLNGVSNVTIDGSNSGGTSRNLTIVNTATTAPTAIALSSAGAGQGVKKIVIKNTAIATGVATTIGYGIAIGGGTPGTSGADNDSVTIQNDSITVAPVGIYASGTAAVSAGGNDSLNIIGNVIDYNGALAGTGIRVGNSVISAITQNKVTEESSGTQAPTGISLETGFVSSTVSRNNITKVLNTNSGGYGGRGLTIGTGTASSNLTIFNNFISGVNGSNSAGFGGSSSMGIAIGTINNSSTITTTAGGISLYNNTVSMAGSMGTASTSAITTALYVGSGASALDIRNNIFSNTQTGTSTTQKNYAIYSAAANTAFSTINNNNYYAANSFNAASAFVGFLSSDRATLTNWQSASGQDALSKSASPVFISASDLHLDNTASANWCNNGTGATIAAVTTDIDLQARSTPPDIGADEFTPTNSTTATPTTQTICSGSSVTTVVLAGAPSFSWTRDNTTAVTGIAASGTGNITGALTNTTNAPVTVTFTITPLNAAGCAIGTTLTSAVIVNPIPNAVSTPSSQTLCSGSAITTIVNSGSVTGTVFGWTRDNTTAVTGIANSGTGNISGTPTNTTTAPVPVTFTITPTYTNAGATCTGTAVTNVVTVDPASALTLTSGVGTDNQAICSGVAITNITYSTVNATGATFSGLPSGVTGSWAANVVTITGTPAATGTYTYTVTLTSNCGAATATGTILVTNSNSLALTSAAATTSQTVCINTPITPITYATTGATGATVTGLPAGITGTWSANVVTISGSPTASGTFTYTVTPTGGCGAALSATGSITVTPANTVALTSGTGTNAQTLCISTVLTNITYATTGATGATFSGLPAGVTGSWASNVATISGIPTASGVFNYTVTLTGGCGNVTANGSITVTPNNTITLTSAAGSNAQTICINTALPNIVYSTTGATGATFSGLPTGVTGAWASNQVTISGTPTVSGTYTYKVTLTGGLCGGTVSASGSITVNPVNTVTLSSAASTNAQTVCINTGITSITYVTTGATGATFSGLPAGVTGSWAANVATISGTPTASGTFNYTVTLTGGCGTTTATGSIVVNPNNAISLTSATGTNAQTLCINTPITNITYSTVGATGATFSGLPAGVTGAWASNVVTISGTPTASGTFSYTVTLTGGPGCGGTVTATGSITVNPNNTATLSSAASTNAQTVCINTPITNITYATTSATGATFTGLPAGVTGSWTSNVATITGTPTASGTFNYTVTLTGGCGAITATGTITVVANNTVTLTSAAGTNAQTLCVNTPITNITYATTSATGATFSGLPSGVSGSWAGNVATISGTPTATGTFNYTVTLTGGCTLVTATGSIVVTPNNTISLSSGAGSNVQTRCQNTAISNITYNTTGATGVTASGLPAGVSASLTGSVVTVSGTPTASGTFNYTVTLTGGCGTVTATGTITVNPLPTISVTPATAAICIGNSVTLTASGASTYTWSPSTGLSATSGSSVTANPTSTITYTITGTNSNGCVNSTTKLVTVNSLPIVTISPATSTTICEGLSTTLTAGGASTYSWSPATGLSATTGTSVVASPTTTTTYTVTGTNINGCVSTATKTVNVLPAPDATITPAGDVNICQGDTVYFTAVPGYFSYTWLLYGGQYQTGSSNTSKTFTGGFYTVTVTDALGCSKTTPVPTIVTVTQKPIPTITPVGGTLQADAGYSSYQWYRNGVLIPGATGQSYTPTSGGSYTVEVRDTTPLHCPGMSLPYIHTGVGVNGNAGIVNGIRLYPNPSSDIVHIDAPVSVNVLVHNMEGKLVYYGKDVHEINISAFPDGVYRVLLTNKDGDYLKTEKVTKMTSH